MNLNELMHNTCVKFAKRNAFLLKNDKTVYPVTFEEFEKRVIRMSAGLKSNGIQNCNVIVSGRNSYEWVLCAFAAIYSGCVVIPIDASLPEEEYPTIVGRSEAEAIMYAKDIEKKCVNNNIKHKICFTDIESIEADGKYVPSGANSESMAIMLFTSGTTSTSKAVMLSHKNFVSNIESPIYNGYFHTGDIGYIDRDGYIFICGRKKNVIVLPNGENVFPEEIESKINEIEGVMESIVIMTGEKSVIGAKVVYDPNVANTADIDLEIAKINDSLVEFKKIRKIEYTTKEFVKTSTGKIKRDAQ